MYKAVVQAMLMYGSKIWVVTGAMMMVLEGFHHRIARRIAGMTVSKGDVVELECSLVDTTLEITWIWPIREYLRRRQETIAEYVSGRPIYILFTGLEMMDGYSRFLRWWDQGHVPKQGERGVG